MSGICGIVLKAIDKHLLPAHLSAMLRSTARSHQIADKIVSLGSVGLATQNFPGRLAGVAEVSIGGRASSLAFHGTLYNLRELLPTTERGSDVFGALLHLYLKEGIEFLQRLRGEFAIAIWDGPGESLYVATDRFRVHPIFYYCDNDKLVFASGMKEILACPFRTERTINPEAIVDLVASSIIPTPKTFFKEIKKLPPAHVLTYYNGEIGLLPYWEISFSQPNSAGEAKLAEKLKAYFADAVAVRLENENDPDRVGTFLSGGVDSSTLTGVLMQLAKRPIKSFSIGFDHQRFNEINYARIAARAFDAEHYEYFVTPKDTYDAIPVLLDCFDEPFANASAVPTYFCAKIAREHGVDVLYAGDGGDELFAGNERYATQRLFEYYSEIPVWVSESLVKPLVFGLADQLRWTPLVNGKKYIMRASIPYPERLSSYGFFRTVPLTGFLEDDLLKAVGRNYDPYAALNYYYRHAPACSELDRQLYVDLKLAISDNDLFKVTRMTEAASVTVRFPFLDHRLAEFAATVPAEIKMRRTELRSFFKRAYSDLIPSEIRKKKKHGFGLPIPVWLQTDRQLNEMMYDLVLSPRSIQRGYFQKKALQDLVERHKADETSFYGTVLWNLMILELWLRRLHDPRLDQTQPPPLEQSVLHAAR